MRISDEKRREIAASLRESREFISGLPKTSLEQNAFDTFERILACVDYEQGNIFDYLADLIDRPTCRLLPRLRSGGSRMTFSEYMQLRERAEAAGVGNDESLARLLHYLNLQEFATLRFQEGMNEMEARCRNLVKEVESRIKEAEKVVE